MLGLVLGLASAEILFRVFHITPGRPPPPKYLPMVGGAPIGFGNKWGAESRPGAPVFHIKQPSGLSGVQMGEYVAGARFRIVYASNPRGYFDADGGIAVEINAFGMRGPEVTRDKPAGTFRILGIGDSFTFGAGVREGDTYLRKLEGALNRRAGAAGYQVLNAGVEGYNTSDELAYLEHRWLDFQPDLILIGFYLNDAYSDATFKNMGEAEGVDLRQPDGPARYSYLWDFVQHQWRTRAQRRAIGGYYRPHYFSDPGARTDVNWTGCRAALARMVELARQRHIRIALVIFPEFYQLDGDYPFERIHALVAATGRELGLPTLDLLPVFRGRRAQDLWVHVTDHHPNQVAHQQAAEAIERFVRAQGLVPASN